MKLPKQTPPLKQGLVSGEVRGLGDAVSKVANKLGIKECAGCRGRAERLNRAFPLKKSKPF